MPEKYIYSVQKAFCEGYLFLILKSDRYAHSLKSQSFKRKTDVPRHTPIFHIPEASTLKLFQLFLLAFFIKFYIVGLYKLFLNVLRKNDFLL